MSMSADVIADIVQTQQAFTVISTMLNYLGYLNPLDGCFTNMSTFDYIIIGGGTSGCVLASRLSEDPQITVLLIEAGGNFPLETSAAGTIQYNHRSNHDWNYTTVNDGYTQQCHRGNNFNPTLGKVLGDTSSTNLIRYSQGDPRDYEEWADITNEPSWKFKNVQRLFKKLERFEDDDLYNSSNAVYHGFDGPVGITKDKSPIIKKYLNAFNEVGYKVVSGFNKNNRLGYSEGVYFIANEDRDKRVLLRQNSAYAYLNPIKTRKNLIVIKYTQVTKILFKSKRAYGVLAESLKNGTTLEFRAKREIIIAAGALNTPKLLQLSGIGPKQMLKKFNIKVIADLPVGENYKNQLFFVINYKTKKTCRPYIPEKRSIYEYSAPSFIGLVALNKSQTSADYKTVNYIVNYTPAKVVVDYTAFVYEFDNDIADSLFDQTIGYENLYSLIQILKPKSKGTVELKSRNPLDPPIIKTNFFSHKDDLRNCIKFAKDFMKIEESSYYKKFEASLIDPTNGRCGKFDLKSDDYWECYILCMTVPQSDHSGTAAMGAVVDGRLRVKGVKGLRVADASIMPTPTSGATTGSTLMIGENAAEMILEDAKYLFKKNKLNTKNTLTNNLKDLIKEKIKLVNYVSKELSKFQSKKQL